MKPLFIAALITATLISATLSAQAPTGKLEFEVASIRAASPLQPDQVVNMGLHMDGSQARIAAFTLKDYIAMAYRIKAYQISGPDQLGNRFDLNAKLPAGSTSDQIPEMLQAFLADRFELKFHREKRELPVYALVLAKTPLKLKEVPDTDDDGPAARDVAVSGSGAGVSVNLGHGTSYSFANNKFEGKRFSMDMLAQQLERYLDRPIVNMTDLKAKYDLSLDVTPEDYQAMLIRAGTSAGLVLPPQVMRLLDGNTPTSLMDSMQQVGLKLDARKAPIDFLVVDQVRKAPTDN